MSVCIAFALLILQDPALGDEVRNETIGFSLRPPAGWKALRADPPTLFKYQAGEGGLPSGDLFVAGIDPAEPKTAASITDELMQWQLKKFEGSERLGQEELKVGGAPAVLIRLKWKDYLVWKTIVARSPVELYLIDVTCALSGEKAGAALAKAVLDSVRFWNPELPKESVAALEAAVSASRELKVPAAMLGESHYLVTIMDKPLGTARFLVREADVAGRPGYEYETLTEMYDTDGGRRVDTSRGRFRVDGSVQSVEAERVLESKDRPRREFRSTVTIEAGRCTISRKLEGRPDECSFALPPGTWITDAADLVRAALVVKGKGMYALRRLDPFDNWPGSELLEVAAPEKMGTPTGERPLVIVLAKTDRGSHKVYRYEVDGRFESSKIPGVRIEIRRCAPEDLPKKP